MSCLSSSECRKLEKLFQMESGYVLDFSNRSFQDAVYDSTGLNIYDNKYEEFGNSKANRLRSFWQKESCYNIYKLNVALLEAWRTLKMSIDSPITDGEQALYNECIKINDRIADDKSGDMSGLLSSISIDSDFSVLAENIGQCIRNNQPEVALDRLHTFMIKFIRNLCDNNNISYKMEKPLHSLFGEYIKHLEQNGKIEATMTSKILKSSISILDAFNDVRNSRSFAHDNKILNYNESMLIYKNIINLVEFLNLFENPVQSSSSKEFQTTEEIQKTEKYDALPF